MSRSKDRIAQTIERMQAAFERTYYFQEAQLHENDTFETKDDLLLSVIIPARNEFPNIVHTVHSIINCLEGDGFTRNDFEIIIINNCSTDFNDPKYEASKPGDRGTTDHLFPRGIYHSRVLRVLYDPIAGNHSARNKGARVARGKYLFFSDAHMSYAPGAFALGLKACEESGGIAHMGIAWMGGYPTHPTSVGTQYTLKLGEEWKGTWATYRPKGAEGWFYIAAQGHCSLFINRKQFLDFGGYPDVHRTYGGGELFVDMLWWMLGSSVVVEPRAVGYHLASSRGYSYNHDDYISNVLSCAYALGCDDWRERTYINYLRKIGKEKMDKIMARGPRELGDRRREIESRRVSSFNDLLVESPWDKKNVERWGASNSSKLIFHDTWLPLLEGHPIAKKAYADSQFQKDLEAFINTHLSAYVYKRVQSRETDTGGTDATPRT